MTYRLLHLADLHLDRSFGALGCRPDLARRRRDGLREALKAAGEAAASSGCSAVTIGGDLYEHERAGVETERFLQQTFASWQPMRVFIAPGNHDALMPGSLYRRVEWPENVHVFTEPALTPAELEDGLTLWGVAHREPAWQGNPLAGGAPGGDGVHLAVFHGAELGSRPEGKAIHGPFRAEAIRAAGFAAALCGHYHRRRVDQLSGLLYPGSPEPLSVDETGPRGPVVVSVIGDGSVDFEPLALNRWSAHLASCDLSAVRSGTEALEAIVDAAISAAAGSEPERCLLRVDCTGALDPAVSLDVASAALAVQERCGAAQVGVVDRTVSALDLEALAAEDSARGAFLRLAEAARSQAADVAEAAVLDDALRYGLAALAGAEVGVR
jgi:DNA repair protein SbcD/Mre11